MKILIAILLIGLCTPWARAQQHDAPLTAEQVQFMADYERIRSALADDNLAAAQSASVALAGNSTASQLTQSRDLASARKCFSVLSRLAVKLVHGKAGFFIFHCSEVKYGDEWAHWVQYSADASNPYLGKSNPRCGKIMQ